MPKKYTNRFKSTPEAEKWRYEYANTLLGEVVTVPEACIIWSKARQTVDDAIKYRKLESRLAITGGTYLITVRSCVQLWGEIPEEALPKAARNDQQLTLFDLEQLAEKYGLYELPTSRQRSK